MSEQSSSCRVRVGGIGWEAERTSPEQIASSDDGSKMIFRTDSLLTMTIYKKSCDRSPDGHVI